MENEVRDLRNYCRSCAMEVRKKHKLIPTYNEMKEPCFICGRLSFEYEQRGRNTCDTIWKTK